jgi:hypothetical protein
VEPFHPDDRFPALQRLGTRLEDILPTAKLVEPLVLAVSSVTQLDPALQSGGFQTVLPPEQSLMLLSRGAVPFTVPDGGVTLPDFARAEAGWMHGMTGVVVQIFREQAHITTSLFPWIS